MFPQPGYQFPVPVPTTWIDAEIGAGFPLGCIVMMPVWLQKHHQTTPEKTSSQVHKSGAVNNDGR